MSRSARTTPRSRIWDPNAMQNELQKIEEEHEFGTDPLIQAQRKIEFGTELKL
jgi:hypothetical protein